MKNFHCCCQKKEAKCMSRRFHKGPNKKNESNDEEHLLFEIFKQFLKAKLEKQRQNQNETQEVPATSRGQEDAEIVDLDEEQNNSCSTNGPKRRCHKFGLFKRGGHPKHWGKHHHGPHVNMHHHEPHHHHHHHGPHQKHRRFSCGKHCVC